MPKVIRQRQNKNRFILLAAVAAVALAGGLYFLLARGPASEQAVAIPGGTQPALTGAPHAELQPGSAEADAGPETATGPPPAAAEDSCAQSYAKVNDFFTYLDRRAYVTAYELKGGSERHFASLVAKLAAKPPVVVRERDDLFTILQNTAHFCLVLGRDNVFLLREILDAETEIIEPTMADFYRWSLAAGTCSQEQRALATPPLEGLYEYAGFFLNTLGGQSYLYRRSPRVRALARYYSVLIIDRAEEQGLNKHGIDIRPALDSLVQEMESLQNLASREEYLRTLRNLQSKYQARHG